MDISQLQQWTDQNPELAQVLTFIGVLLLIVLSYLVAYRLIGRALIHFAGRTESKYDDEANHLSPPLFERPAEHPGQPKPCEGREKQLRDLDISK